MPSRAGIQGVGAHRVSPYIVRWEPLSAIETEPWATPAPPPECAYSPSPRSPPPPTPPLGFQYSDNSAGNCVDNHCHVDSVYNGSGLLHIYCLAPERHQSRSHLLPLPLLSFDIFQLHGLCISCTAKVLPMFFFMAVWCTNSLVSSFLTKPYPLLRTLLLFPKPSLGLFPCPGCQAQPPPAPLPVLPGLLGSTEQGGGGNWWVLSSLPKVAVTLTRPATGWVATAPP